MTLARKSMRHGQSSLRTRVGHLRGLASVGPKQSKCDPLEPEPNARRMSMGPSALVKECCAAKNSWW